MSAQQKTEDKPQAIISLDKPMAAITSLVNASGEIDFAKLNIAERMQKYNEFKEQANANLPLWETMLLSQIHPGTSFVPLPIIPGPSDCWDGEDAKSMKLKNGMVEPSADFMIKIANLLDIRLTKTFEGVRKETGTPMYSVRYTATMTLPNGTPMTITDVGKDQVLNNSYGVQAHIVENTQKKARRNAVKAILGLPTTMTEQEFKRPWVLLRPVFREGQSTETNMIVAAQRQQQEADMRQLYPAAAIDITATEVPCDIEALSQAIEECVTPDDLAAMHKRLGAARMTGDERAQLGAAFKARKKLVETGEIKTDAPTPTPTPEGDQF